MRRERCEVLRTLVGGVIYSVVTACIERLLSQDHVRAGGVMLIR